MSQPTDSKIFIDPGLASPVTLDPLMEAEFRLMEPPKSSGRTRLGRTAENAGALNELPMPTVS